jgi:hypothetical protein
MGARIDATGKRFARLVGMRRAGRNKHGQTMWLWRCDCGEEAVRALYRVRTGDTQSCGCLRREYHALKVNRIKLPAGEASFNALYQAYRYRARKLKCEWAISKDEFRRLTKLPCYYCGVEPYFSRMGSRDVNGPYVYTGLDRVENRLGYVIDNVAPCCGICNRAKSTMSAEDFLLWVRRVYENQEALRQWQSGPSTGTEKPRLMA